MTYDPHVHRTAEREQCLRLVQAGRGWHDYAREKAKELEKDDPTLHRGLLAAVQAEIAATKGART